MEWRDGCGNIAQDWKSRVATMDQSILGGPELDLVKSMDMTIGWSGNASTSAQTALSLSYSLSMSSASTIVACLPRSHSTDIPPPEDVEIENIVTCTLLSNFSHLSCWHVHHSEWWTSTREVICKWVHSSNIEDDEQICDEENQQSKLNCRYSQFLCVCWFHWAHRYELDGMLLIHSLGHLFGVALLVTSASTGPCAVDCYRRIAADKHDHCDNSEKISH